jgi:hypothetical protein
MALLHGWVWSSHLHRFAAGVLRKSIAFEPFPSCFFVNPRVLTVSNQGQFPCIAEPGFGMSGGVDASLHEVYSKTAVAEAAPAAPPAVTRP